MYHADGWHPSCILIHLKIVKQNMNIYMNNLTTSPVVQY